MMPKTQFTRLAAARDDLQALREVTVGRLRIGAIPIADTALVPLAMAAFRTSHPGVAAGSMRLESTLLGAAPGLAFVPRIPFVVAEWTAKQGLVDAGLGITLVRSLAASATRSDIVLVPLDAEDFARVVYVATASGVTDSAALEAFLEFLQTAAERVHTPVTATKRGTDV